MKHLIAILFIILCAALYILYSKAPPSAQALITEPSEFNLSKVAKGVYVHYGKHVTFEDEQHDDIANLGFIVGDQCIAVIDTGGSIAIAKKFKQRIVEISDKPICYIINTHVHVDHVLGNAVFKHTDTEFVGHVNLFEAMSANKDFFLNEFANDLGEYANEEGIIIPSMLVEDTLQLDLGNRTLTLHAFSTAHTNTDLIVVDELTQTAFLGDLLFIDRIPALDGSLKGWLNAIDDLKQLHLSKAIPGHGSIVNWPDGIADEQHYLNLLLNEIRTALDKGSFMEDIVDHVGSEEKLHWLLHEQHHKRNVTKAFSELEWE